MGLKKIYKIDQLCNYIILLTNHPLLFTASTDMKNTFIQTSCDLFDLSHDSTWLAWVIAMTWLDLLDFDHSNLGLAWDLKVKTWDLLMTCTHVTYSHLWSLERQLSPIYIYIEVWKLFWQCANINNTLQWNKSNKKNRWMVRLVVVFFYVF